MIQVKIGKQGRWRQLAPKPEHCKVDSGVRFGSMPRLTSACCANPLWSTM